MTAIISHPPLDLDFFFSRFPTLPPPLPPPPKKKTSEPQYFDRIALLGRDAEEVFPSRSKAAAASAADAAAAALGARRFVSEKELEGLKAARGGGPSSALDDHPESSSGKSLAEVLRERAAAKAAAVEETWRQMKVGTTARWMRTRSSS